MDSFENKADRSDASITINEVKFNDVIEFGVFIKAHSKHKIDCCDPCDLDAKIIKLDSNKSPFRVLQSEKCSRQMSKTAPNSPVRCRSPEGHSDSILKLFGNKMEAFLKLELFKRELDFKAELKACQMDALKREEESQSIKNDFLSAMEGDLQCIICSELFINAVTLGCSHSFCEHCINCWLQRRESNNQCPVCKTTVISQVRSLALDSYINNVLPNLDKELQQVREELIKSRKELKLIAQKNIETVNHHQSHRQYSRSEQYYRSRFRHNSRFSRSSDDRRSFNRAPYWQQSGYCYSCVCLG